MQYGRVQHLVHMHMSESERVLFVRDSPTPVARGREWVSNKLRVLIISTVSFQLQLYSQMDSKSPDRPTEKAATRANSKTGADKR